MATIFVDNTAYEVEEGQNLLQACLSLGFDLPYFCWHPALHSVGACRQCAVKQFQDETDTRGRIVMACMTPATTGVRISIDDAEARAFRASVVEWLMTNHPHDCPVCDEGGECHLQDMTVMTGHNYRRFRFAKRTHVNQYLGPFIHHEMNRCIQCYRCVRFYRDYAGGRDLDVFGAHNHVYFGRHEDGVLENEFSGNLVEVCPTGVFTDKTLRDHYSRKWDLQTAPSICVHCSLGCNTIPGERYGKLRRVLNRYHGDINGYFLCDRGRFGYQFVNHELRLRVPLVRIAGAKSAIPTTREAALVHLTGLLEPGARVIGIGSPRASLEANWALRRLVGPSGFYQGITGRERRLVTSAIEILRQGPARSPSLREVRSADAVLVLGEDVTNYAPVLALALRQSVRQAPMRIARKLGIPDWNDAMVRTAVNQERGPLFVATTGPTKLEEVASGVFRAAPDELARLGHAVARILDPDAPEVSDLSEEMATLANSISQALCEAERPLVVSGTGSGSEDVLRAAASVAWALCRRGLPAMLSLTVPEANSLGLGLMGGGSLDSALQRVLSGEADTVIVLENDLYRRAPRAVLDQFLSRCRHLIAVDVISNSTTAEAEVVLPASTFAESDGIMVSSEGRAQRYYRVFPPSDDVQASWRWLRDIMIATGRLRSGEWSSQDDVLADLAEAMPQFRPVLDSAPLASFRVMGQKVPRQSQRYSGRTAISAHLDVNEPAPPPDVDAPMSFSMEGYPNQPPPALIARYWAPGWNSVQALNKFHSEVGGPLRGGDPGRRLIEPRVDGSIPRFEEVPQPFRPRHGEWLAVPVYHIFGSEELSALAPAIAERAPQPYVGLNPADAEALAAPEGAVVRMSLGVGDYALVLRLVPSLPSGLAAVSARTPAALGLGLPAWCRLAYEPGDERGPEG